MRMCVETAEGKRVRGDRAIIVCLLGWGEVFAPWSALGSTNLAKLQARGLNWLRGIALCTKPILELRIITCHTGSVSVICHLTQVVGWWRGVVGNTFWLKRSYSTPGPVSTAMGDCLRAGKPSRCEACQLGRLSHLPSVGQ